MAHQSTSNRGYRPGNDLSPQPLPPGREDELNPQPLPPGEEKAITLEAFAESVTRGVLRAVEARQAPGRHQNTSAPQFLPSRIIMGWIFDPVLGEVGGPQSFQSQSIHGPDGPPPAPQPPPGPGPPRPEPGGGGHPE